MTSLTQILSEIKARYQKALDAHYEEFDTTMDSLADIPRLVAALERMLSEVKRSTDNVFYDHCVSKVEAILSGKGEK